jgi:hypothetical protein
MKNNKVLTLAALVLSAYAINQSSDITRKQDTPPVAESLLNYSASLDLNFIEFRNHREINRSIGFNS